MRRTGCVITVLWLMPHIGPHPSVFAEDSQKPASITKQDLIDAWRRRSGDIRSFQFVWAERLLDRLAPIVQSELLALHGRSDSISEEDQEAGLVDVTRRFVMDGHRGRYEHDNSGSIGPRPEDDRRGVYCSVFAEEYHRSLYPGREIPGGLKLAIGFIFKERQPLERGNWNLYPLLITFRPLDPLWSAFDPDDYVVVPDGEPVNGRPCVKLLCAALNRTADRAFWIDPQMDFAVVQYQVARDDVVRQLLTIEHHHDAKHGWIPSAWRTVRHSPEDRLIVSSDCVVSVYEINQPVDASTFKLPFPPGTRVTDYTTDGNYIVRADGSKRPITQGELQSGPLHEIHERLATTEPGFPFALGALHFVVLLNIGILSVLVLLVAYRMYKQRGEGGLSPRKT